MPVKQENLERISPRLRVFGNSDDEVNRTRSLLSGAVDAEAAPSANQAIQQALSAPPRKLAKPRSLKGKWQANKSTAACFVQLVSDRAAPPDLKAEQRNGDLIIARLKPGQIERIANNAGKDGVAYIDMGETLAMPHAPLSGTPTKAPRPRAAKLPTGVGRPRAKRGVPSVIIGIIDVGGFDFAHPDFIDPKTKKTRFLRIWDQGGSPGPLFEQAPKPFELGVELTHERMQQAIDYSRKSKGRDRIAATDVLRQSVQQPSSHATHVASIAAGNLGACPHAAIVGVSMALETKHDRNNTLYDSTRLALAVDYLFGLGQRLYKRPVPTVINISLGTNGHAHDGTSAICRWIDRSLIEPGRAVCVAAGNSGQEAPQFDGDLGYLSGRIHASGQVASAGLETELEWQVVGNGIADVSENELEIWYEPGDEFEVRLRTPSHEWIGPIAPHQYVLNHRLASETRVSIFNERYLPANGANRISIVLSPRLKKPVIGIEAGTWIVRIRGREIRNGRFDAWIERDDPRPLGRHGNVESWRFPSYFSSRSNVDRSSVSSLACGHRVISVGNCDELAERIHPSSSQGPTRDGRLKPEIAAFGSNVVAARGFSSPAQRWVSMTGTSMASPYVAGVAAQMLSLEPKLTAAQIAGIMRRTAQPMPGSDYSWQDAAGFGRIDPAACLDQVKTPFRAEEISP